MVGTWQRPHLGKKKKIIFHTYWDWVSMLMLMALERNFYFVFVHRMFLPFYFFSYTVNEN